MLVDGKAVVGTAAPIGARLSSMVGCSAATGPVVLTVNGTLKDSRTLALFATPLKLYVTSVVPSTRGRSMAVPSTVVSVAPVSASVTVVGNRLVSPVGKSVTRMRIFVGVF